MEPTETRQSTGPLTLHQSSPTFVLLFHSSPDTFARINALLKYSRHLHIVMYLGKESYNIVEVYPLPHGWARVTTDEGLVLEVYVGSTRDPDTEYELEIAQETAKLPAIRFVLDPHD